MKKVFLLLLLSVAFQAIAQTAFVRPSKAKSADEKISISAEKDVKQFAKYLKKYGQPQILSIGEGIDANAFFSEYTFLEEVSQLVFHGNNNINPAALCEMASLTHVTFYVKEKDSSFASVINACSYISEVSYVFEKDIYIAPDWFDLKHVSTLNIIGIFSKKQLKELLPLLNAASRLKHLRLSTDYTRDLPEELLALTQLKSFGMIDNLSFIQNQSFTDLAVEQYHLNYWDAVNKSSELIYFDYYSDRITLENYDFDYLSKIFEDAQVLEYVPPMESPLVVNTQKSNKNEQYGVSEFSFTDTVDRKPMAALYFKINPFVQSLDGQYVPEYEHFTINPLLPNAISSKKGFRITFPPNALGMEDGTDCKQTVDVYFRLIQNPVEMALTGVPAQYDSFNDYYSLKNSSICMLYASSNSIPVMLKDGYAIDIEMPFSGSRDFMLSSDVAFWYPKEDLSNKSLTRFKITSINDTFKPTPLADLTVFEERYLNPKYYYLLDRNETKVKIPKALKSSYTLSPKGQIYEPFVKGMVLEKKENYLKPGRALIGLRKISYADTGRRNNTYFRIYRLVDKRLFPELQYFENYVFQYDGPIERKEFTKALIRGKKFYDVRIVYTAGAKSGILELKYEGGFVQFPFLVIQNGTKKSAAKQIAAFGKRFKKYEILVAKRKAYHQVHLVNYNNYLLANQEQYAGKKRMSITAFGTYCFADISTTENFGSINLLVNDPRGIPLDIKKIVVIYKDGFAMDYFNNKNEVKLDFSKEFAILVADYKNNVYYITASTCKSLKGGEGSVKSINSRLVDERIGDAETLLKSLGFSKERK